MIPRAPSLAIPLIAFFLLAPIGCGLLGRGTEAETSSGATDEADSPNAEAEDGKPDKAGGGGQSAAGAAVPQGSETSDCPKSLAGKESIDRTITKACGTIPVTATYSIEGATLTLEAGARLEFKDGAELRVGYYEPSKIVVKGTAEEPVVLSASGDKVPGAWGGVRLYAKSSRSSIDGLVIEHAGGKNGALSVEGEDVEVRNSKISSADELGILVQNEGSFAAFENNSFENTGLYAMRVTPPVAGQIGAGNKFADGLRVHVAAGKIEQDCTWGAIGTPYVISKQIRIDGKDDTRATLALAAGAELQFDRDASLAVGYYGEATLAISGTGTAPVKLTSDERKEPGSWHGVEIHRKGEAIINNARFEYGGDDENKGVLLVENKARLELQNTTFADNTAGVVIKGKESELRASSGNAFENTPIAYRLMPDHVIDLAGDNKFSGEPKIIIEAGSAVRDGTWSKQPGARVEIHGNLRIDGASIELEAGSKWHVKDGSAIDVGYYETASLRAVGTADANIEIVGTRDDPGAWKSLTFHRKAHGNALEHVLVRNAGAKGGVVFARESDGKVDTLVCERCEGETLAVDANAKVEQTAVSSR